MSRSIMKTTNIGIKKVALNKKKATHKSPISPLNLPQYAFSLLERENHRVEVVSKKKRHTTRFFDSPGTGTMTGLDMFTSRTQRPTSGP